MGLKTVLALSLVSLLLAGLPGMVTTASADQRDPKLPGLFEKLQNATGSGSAEQIESEIWMTWLATDDDKSDVLLRNIVSAMGSGDMDEALMASDALIEQNPEFAEGWNKRATVHYLMGNVKSSVEDIHRTLQLEPRHFGAISGLGLIFLKQGNLSAALEAFEEVLKISPQSVNAQRSVEQVRSQIGEEI